MTAQASAHTFVGPADSARGQDMTPAQRSQELDRLAQPIAARDTTQRSESDKYVDAVRAVVAQRPDLRPE